MPARVLLLVLSFLLLLPCGGALARDASDEAVLEAMRAGGVILLIRHEVTESGIGDPPEFTLEKCETQRNLSARGRERSRLLGQRLEELGVRVDEVRSSQWCRCVDTAELAFGGRGEVQPWPVLNSLFANRAGREQQTREAYARAAELPAGETWVWVTHQFNINAFTEEYTAMGDVIVARPRDGGLEVVGKWRP